MRDARALRPRRTHFSNTVYHLEGGTEDNDLWTCRTESENGIPVICSTWVPTKTQREAIAKGENIELIIFGHGQPPVQLRLDDAPLGKPPPV